MAEAIRARLKAKDYDGITSPSQFASTLQADARAVVDDRHLRVSFSSSPMPRMMIRRGPPSAAMIAQMRRQNAAIPEVKILNGNIGYMPVNGMLPAQAANDAIAAAFAFLHNTDALIIDLRANPGGSGYAEVYMSYLSEGAPYVTGSVHWRKGDRVQEFKTVDVGEASYGAKKPVFVLTSHWTFSAAEGLAYEIQSFKRGVIIGETTGGGANPSAGGGAVDIGHGFSANVPTGYVVNSVTGTNWEGMGVKPDVPAPADRALAKAWSLAADRLKPTATDPQTRTSLEAITLAKLEGAPALAASEIVGKYGIDGGHVFVLGPMSIPVTIVEKDHQLDERGLGGEVALLPAGGDRYNLAGVPYNLSLIFFKKDGKIELLQSNFMGSLVLEKQ